MGRFEEGSRVMVTEEEVRALLGKYHVHKHWKGATAAGAPRYAVFTKGSGPLTEPTTHGLASAERDRLTAVDIVALVAARS
jgi:hypothetical protein